MQVVIIHDDTCRVNLRVASVYLLQCRPTCHALPGRVQQSPSDTGPQHQAVYRSRVLVISCLWCFGALQTDTLRVQRLKFFGGTRWFEFPTSKISEPTGYHPLASFKVGAMARATGHQ